MNKKERMVMYYDLSISAKSRTFSAPRTITVKKAFELISKLFDSTVEISDEKKSKKISNDKELLYVSDWDWDSTNNIISILINKSDQNKSDPVFTNPPEKSRREVEKFENEGEDFAVHLVIKLSNDDEPALLLIESCQGLGISIVQKLLNQLLKNSEEFNSDDNFRQLHPDGSIDNNGEPKKYHVSFQFDVRGHLSDNLRDDLEQGKIQSIELITDREKHTPMDSDPYFEEKCKTLVLTVQDENHSLTNVYNRIVNVVNSKKDDYSQAKIKFTTSTNIIRTVDMSTADGLAQVYVKKEKLDGFDVDLKSSYDRFNTAILEKIKELL
jgi:hypothetical protein